MATSKTKLMEKFGKKKAVDPLKEEEKRLLQNMQQGLMVILDMHNVAELGSLCGCLGLQHLCTEGSHKQKRRGGPRTSRRGTSSTTNVNPCFSRARAAKQASGASPDRPRAAQAGPRAARAGS